MNIVSIARNGGTRPAFVASSRPVASPDMPGDTFQPTLTALAPTNNTTQTLTPHSAVAAATQIVQQSVTDQPKASVDIKDVQAELTQELPDVKVNYLHTDSFGDLNGRLATKAELTAMIESLKDESGIPFGYITDGCYARAHLMDESFRQHGINFAKMFVRGDLAAKNEHMEARWWYHVAPLVFVDDGQGNPEAKIIDPGFSDQPMDPSEWVKAMNQGPSIQVDLVDSEQYYPRRGGKPDTFAESLAPAVRTMQSYSRRLHDHRAGKGQDPGDYVKPTWNEKGAGGDFVIDGERRTIFPEGVNTSAGSTYSTLGTGNGPLVELEPTVEPVDVSASWAARPSDFDPYAW